MKTLEILRVDKNLMNIFSYGVGAISRESDEKAAEFVKLGLAKYVPKSRYKQLKKELGVIA